MPTFRNTAAILVAAVSGTLMLLPTAQAGANCVAYAKISLQQQQDNARSCKLSGPDWEADMKTLLAWCGSVSPKETQAMLRKRRDALTSCKAG